MEIPLLQTKLYAPAPQPGLVHRPRLTKLIGEGLARKLTLISGPPGSGKTTLLRDWTSTSRPLVAWLSLEEADNDSTRFWTYFMAALQELHEDLAKDAQELLHEVGQQTRPVQLEAVLTALINDLSDFPREFALVLDDYQHINQRAIHEGLTFLIDHLPPRMHLIITCRVDPPLPLARLRARGQLIEVRSADLRFTSEEAVTFLNQTMKLNLTDDQVVALEARTEGWIVGLQLAAISLQKQEDPRLFIDSFTGSHRFILDYLLDEVLNREPENVQSFLLETSILERFTSPLCNEMMGANNAPEMLMRLEQANLFIVPLDNERHWYRYHNLFADLLRSRLQELKPDRVQELHRRACVWFEREGLLPEAINHAISMPDFERAAQLMERAAETQRQRGEIATLSRWMNTLPGSVRRSHPVLCLAYARALVDTSQNLPIEGLIDDAEAGLETSAFSGDSSSAALRGQIAALRGYLSMIRQQYPETIDLSRRARELLPEDAARWRSFVGLTLAGAYRFSNDWAAAAQTYLEASDLSRAVGDGVNALLALGLRGEVLQAQGHLHQAVDQFEQVLQLAGDLGVPKAPSTAYALIGLGRILCEWNDLEAADQFVQRGLKYGKRADMQDISLRGYLALARIRQTRGDLAGALEALDNAEPAARQIGMAEIKDWIQAVRVQVWLARGDATPAIGWASSYTGELQDTIYPSIAIAMARARLAQGQPEAAVGFLEHALQAARAVGRLGNAVPILVVKAIAQEAGGDRRTAISTVSDALTHAAPEGYIRVFLDEGDPMRSLISEFRRSLESEPRGTVPQHQRTILDYTGQLLDAFTISSAHRESMTLPLQSSIPEPLTGRELEVLRLIKAGLSNRDIAAKDIVSINTVKTQVRSIYGKLGVHKRADAIIAADRYGLF